MPNKPKITSKEQYIKALLSEAFLSKEQYLNQDWNEMIKERYDRDSNIYTYRINDFINENLLGKDGHYIEAYTQMEDLDKFISDEKDPVKKSQAMAARNVIAPMVDEFLEAATLTRISSYKDAIKEKYEIPPQLNGKMNQEFQKAEGCLLGTFRGRAMPAGAKLKDYPAMERFTVLNTVMESFFDKTVPYKRDGTPIRETPLLGELFKDVNDKAKEILSTAMGEKGSNFKPVGTDEKSDFDSLKSSCKGMGADKKAAAHQKIDTFATFQGYREMDIEPHLTEVKLTLEKNPIVKTTAEEFLRKQKAGTLDYSELEWGETSVDRMLEKMYTKDQLKSLKSAGIDPCAGVYVDGKPLWSDNEKSIGGSSTTLDRAKAKCDLISKALEGGKIDVCKFVPNGKGGFKFEKPVPVKTEMNMKKESRSFFTWLKQTFGYEKSMTDKIKEANTADRKLPEPDQKKMMEQAQIDAVHVQALAVQAAAKKADMKNDEHFFASVLRKDIEASKQDKTTAIGLALNKRLNYTSHTDKNARMMTTMDRPTSRVSIMYLYGMSKGYSLDQMMDPNDTDMINNKNKMGKEFVDLISVDTLDEYTAKQKPGPTADETRKKYNDYLMEKREKINGLCVDMFETLKKQELIIPDMSDPASVLKDYQKISQIGKMATDFMQVFAPLKNNSINPSDKEAAPAGEKSAAIQNYTYNKILPMQVFSDGYKKCVNYMASKDYVNKDYDPTRLPIITEAARSKSFVFHAADKLAGKKTWGEFIDAKDDTIGLTALGFACGNISNRITDFNGRAHHIYMRSNMRDFSVQISGTEGKLYDGMQEIGTSTKVNELTHNLEEATKNLKDFLPEGFEKNLKEAYKTTVKEPEKKVENLKEKITLSELSGKEEMITRPPVKSEKTMEKTLEKAMDKK